MQILQIIFYLLTYYKIVKKKMFNLKINKQKIWQLTFFCDFMKHIVSIHFESERQTLIIFN